VWHRTVEIKSLPFRPIQPLEHIPHAFPSSMSSVADADLLIWFQTFDGGVLQEPVNLVFRNTVLGSVHVYDLPQKITGDPTLTAQHAIPLIFLLLWSEEPEKITASVGVTALLAIPLIFLPVPWTSEH